MAFSWDISKNRGLSPQGTLESSKSILTSQMKSLSPGGRKSHATAPETNARTPVQVLLQLHQATLRKHPLSTTDLLHSSPVKDLV